MSALTLLRAGLRTTIQDDGRPGYAHLGVPPAGAVDSDGLARANALVANPATTAALEVTLGGLELRAVGEVLLGLAGAEVTAWVDGEQVDTGGAIRLGDGQALRLARPADGVYTYVAIRGGLDVEPVLGSRCTDTLCGLGPPALTTGQHIGVAAVAAVQAGPSAAAAGGGVTVGVTAAPALRLHPGPHLGQLPARCWQQLLEREWSVSPATDRSAARLRGEPIEVATGRGIDSEGLVAGALQLPGDGLPIVFLANHPVTGGYPVIAVLDSADLARLAQLRPGRALRFTPA